MDSKEGEGPETITLKSPVAGTYSFWVEDQTHAEDPQSPVLATQAGAQVTIWQEDQPPVVKPVAATPGAAVSPEWHGFDIVVGGDGKVQIVDVNKFYNGLPGK